MTARRRRARPRLDPVRVFSAALALDRRQARRYRRRLARQAAR